MNTKYKIMTRTINRYPLTLAGVRDRTEKLINELLQLDDMVDIDLDMSSLYDINYICLLPKWDEYKHLPNDDFYDKRHEFIADVLRVCAENGCKLTADRIEDYGGGWFYIVLRCDWLKGEK